MFFLFNIGPLQPFLLSYFCRPSLKDSVAIGAECEIEGTDYIFESKNVILSAGAICSPQLLMLSGIGPSDHLANFGIETLYNSPSVGKNLRDHPRIPLVWNSINEIELQKNQSPMQVVLRYTSTNSSFRNDIYIIVGAVSTDQTVRMGVGLYKAISAGSINLNTDDPYSQPVINYNYFSDDFDLKRTREAVRISCEIASAAEFINVDGYPIGMDADLLFDDQALDLWMKTNVDTFHHISGTCKMGSTSDPTSVVDEECNVIGVKNLRVVDSSIFPNITNGNLNGPTIMTAEKASDHIMGKGVLPKSNYEPWINANWETKDR